MAERVVASKSMVANTEEAAECPVCLCWWGDWPACTSIARAGAAGLVAKADTSYCSFSVSVFADPQENSV